MGLRTYSGSLGPSLEALLQGYIILITLHLEKWERLKLRLNKTYQLLGIQKTMILHIQDNTSPLYTKAQAH